MKSQTLRLLVGMLALSGMVGALVAIFVGGAAGGGDNSKIRWDISQLSGAAPSIHLLAGGRASACGESPCSNKITLTGTGTFRLGEADEVTGGGTWATSGPDVGTQSGTYRVTRLVSFELAPGSLPSPPFISDIPGVPLAGLAVLRIVYSDGSRGVLTVSCDLPTTPAPFPFEGITTTKRFFGYWNRVAPTGSAPFVLGTNENRTQFRVLPGEDDDD